MNWKILTRGILTAVYGCAAIVPCVRAVNAVFIPGSVSGGSYTGGAIQVQGSSARIDLPVSFQSASINFSQDLSAAGATGNGSTVYTLLSSAIPSDNSVLILSDPNTGAYLGQVQLNTRLSDIAYTNGQLYGIVTNSTALQIDTIAANGTAQMILNEAEPSSSATWRLSGAANGSALLAARGSTATNAPGFVINPTSLQVSQISLPGTAETTLYDTVINSAANTVTSIAPASQYAASFPSGTPIGTVALDSDYGTAPTSRAVSDEFTYTYAPSSPAIVQVVWTQTNNLNSIGETDGLVRSSQVITASGPTSILNFVTPDGTTLSNVASTNQITQENVPGQTTTPFTISEQDAAPGGLSNRAIGQASATLNLATAVAGQYEIDCSPAMTANYSYGSTTDNARPVQVDSLSAIQFAFDPISANIIGNGDASLETAGWEGLQGSFPGFISQFVNPDPSNHGFLLIPQATYPAAIRQTLQESTASSPMSLSFTYNLEDFPNSTPDNVQVYLAGELVANLTATSSTAQTFQTIITDPSLENLSDATFLIQTTSSDPSGDFVEIGNISLTAVPEPASVSLLFLGATALLRRRSHLMK